MFLAATLGYREKALDCEISAGFARDEDARLMFIELAGQWRDLADQTERFGLTGNAR